MEARCCRKGIARAYRALALAATCALYGMMPGIAAADPLSIERAEWRSEDRELRVKGKGTDGRTVVIKNAGDGAALSTDTVDDEEWERRIRNLTQVPCRVRVEQSNGEVRERDVRNRPSNCGPVAGAPPTLSIGDASVNEGGTASFTVSLSAPSTQQVTVVASTANGTATAGSDYTARSNVTVTFPAGSTSQTFAVATLTDNVNEGSETFTVNLSGAVNATMADAQGVGTINNVAVVTPTVSITGPAAAVNEGGALAYTVTRSVASASALTVNLGVGGTATQGTDFTAIGTTVTIPANATTAILSVATIDDTAAEASETVVITLAAGAGYAVGTPGSATGTINASDQVATAPTVSIGNAATVTEGGTLNYTVARSVASASALTVAFTVGGTATAGQDFTAPALTVTIPANATSASVNVATINDTVVEPAESVTITLAAGNGYTVGTPASGSGTINDNDGGPVPNVSINSTSQSCGGAGQAACGSNPVTQQPAPGSGGAGNTTVKILAVNDLGMHCGDLDTRVASILPPFNVLRAQIFQQPAQGQAPVKNPAGMTVSYSATSNPNDPALAVTPTRVPSTNGVYKTNFWDIARQAYDPFYPAGILPAFYPPNANILDLGLPVPDVERLYLGDGTLTANQQRMPGILAPYATTTGGNAPQNFALQVATQPFFTNFPFGYTSNVNWHTAEGVPITTFDDFGRENPYPLLRVQARNSTGTIVATVDTVVPVSSEADCQGCHADPADVQDSRTRAPTDALRAAGLPVEVSINDPKFGSVPTAASVEWASDHNILRLHDLRHQTSLINSQPVVCQSCHYTPALDLAHVGPNDVNGRSQSNNQSMSRVIHNHHAQFTTLFPPMPAPIQTATGTITNQAQRLQVLDQTCYSCHPGQRTKCLRGAMSNGGMLCQDCHGDMSHVGNDFSRNQPGGGFLVSGDYYTNVNTPRVPWANEPGCGSCHTGDASSNLSTSANVLVNTRDIQGNVDNIRLRQAFRSNDANRKPIVPANKRFAENVITPGATTAPGNNPKLYRVSVDNHGAANGGGSGIFCEACHGATHAEWPNANPNANDNVTANQLQGHTGVIAECSTCHGTSLNNYNGLDGPHGLHVIGGNASTSPPFANSSLHRVLGNNFANCAGCHGGTSRGNSPGTVLSRTLADRRINGQTVPKGTPIGCNRCH